MKTLLLTLLIGVLFTATAQAQPPIPPVIPLDYDDGEVGPQLPQFEKEGYELVIGNLHIQRPAISEFHGYNLANADAFDWETNHRIIADGANAIGFRRALYFDLSEDLDAGINQWWVDISGGAGISFRSTKTPLGLDRRQLEVLAVQFLTCERIRSTIQRG